MTVKSGIITITSQLHVLAQDQPATYPGSRPANYISWLKTSQLHTLSQVQMTVKSGIITITSQLHILAQDQPTTYPVSRPDDGEVCHNNYNQPSTYPGSRPANYIPYLKSR